MVQHLRLSWFLDAMAIAQEVTQEDVQELQRLQSALDAEQLVPQPGGSVTADTERGGVAAAAPPAVEAAVGDLGAHAISDELLEAIIWWTGIKNSSCAFDVAEQLMPAEREEQLLRYRNRDREPKAPAQRQKRLVIARLLASRMEVAGAFDEHIRSLGWEPGQRLPYGSTRSFMDAWDWGSLCKAPLWKRTKCVRTWHNVFVSSKYASAIAEAVREPGGKAAKAKKGSVLKWNGRRRDRGGGRLRKCPWLRQALYEWWSSIRHSVDWEAIKRGMRSRSGEPKKIARFTQSMLQTKALELTSVYVTEQLRLGRRPAAVELRSCWWASWRKEYGLSMRYANRKFKCPLDVLEERLERGWLNVFRVRAACLLLTGDDPEMENFDQSPFHHNETGSANARTLAVAGVTVPLVECHTATRQRWTANFMTVSDKERLRREGPPPMECMFKAEGGGEKIRPRLLQHLRCRGHGSWVSATTSTKGSYRTPDVLAYLERHLPHPPEPPQRRSWRIMMADDHGPHLSPLVSKLCWSRGYVFIAHGGGVTPVVQTVDTHLNQHAKREYMKKEGAALLRAMRLGKCVPQLDQTQCIDLMVEVMSNMGLHLAAAEGFWETGFKANLCDAELDARICKEAGYFWRKLGMRDKVNAAVAEVREQVKAGRLRWIYKDIMRLILPHPRHAKCDDVLANLGDDTALDESDKLWHGMEGADDALVRSSSSGYVHGDDGESGASSEGGDESESDDGWSAVGEFDQGWELPCPTAAAVGESVVAAPPGVSERHMGDAERTSDLMKAYASFAEELRSFGDISAAAFMENQLCKERRRVREQSREDPAVQLALTAFEDAQNAALRNEKRLRDLAAQRREELNRLGTDVQKARRLLKAERAKLMDAEAAVDVKHNIMKMSLSDLGANVRNCGGVAGRNARLHVLNRLAALGSGLSPAQRSDFGWFQRDWGAAGIQDFDGEWPETFATWMQNILDEILGGNPRAFSLFVHSETKRRLSGCLAIALPAAGSAPQR